MREVKYIRGQEYFFINGKEVNKEDFLKATPEEIQNEFIAKIQTRLDDFVRTRGYDNMLSACTYANSNIPQFATEGNKAIGLRDLTWSKSYELLDNAISSKNIPSWESFEAQLPELSW